MLNLVEICKNGRQGLHKAGTKIVNMKVYVMVRLCHHMLVKIETLKTHKTTQKYKSSYYQKKLGKGYHPQYLDIFMTKQSSQQTQNNKAVNFNFDKAKQGH